ncbi:unnamed protein product [Schistocephalus solidus]|uniref:Helicase n=1 Tax=Schistocephalus solidus TaxID=70667 RepID=A0A183SKR9_SCHSO|nr:unnamed protein product [Schistocephalus solidus]
MHPHGLLPRRKVEEGVRQQETVFRIGSQKSEAVIVTANETMATQPSQAIIETLHRQGRRPTISFQMVKATTA